MCWGRGVKVEFARRWLKEVLAKMYWLRGLEDEGVGVDVVERSFWRVELV